MKIEFTDEIDMEHLKIVGGYSCAKIAELFDGDGIEFTFTELNSPTYFRMSIIRPKCTAEKVLDLLGKPDHQLRDRGIFGTMSNKFYYGRYEAADGFDVKSLRGKNVRVDKSGYLVECTNVYLGDKK